MKYIDAEKLKEKIQPLYEVAKNGAHFASQTGTSSDCAKYDEAKSIYEHILWLIDSLQQEQPDDLASLISEATNVANRIVDRDSFYNSLPQNLRDKYTSKAWCEILKALSTMKGQEQPEVDLEKEIERFYGMYRDEEGEYRDLEDNGIVCPWYVGENQLWIKYFARHFWNRGYNARNNPAKA